MFERLARSLELVSASWNVLKKDKSLLAFPVLSSVALALVIAFLILPFFSVQQWMTAPFSSQNGGPTRSFYGWSFVFYLVSFIVINFFNTALAIVVLARFDGHALSAGQGLREAAAKLPDLLMYSVISATIGTLLNFVEDRFGFIGKIAVGLVGAAWGIATYLAIPVLAAENVGPGEAISRSLKLLRKCWGEGLIGNAGLGLASFLAVLLVLAVSLGLFKIGHSSFAFAFGIVGVIAVSLVFTTLDVIYRTALYRYAVDGESGLFAEHMLSEAFEAR